MNRELRKITVKLYPRQYDIVSRMAENSGTTVSDIVRLLIDRGLDERVLEDNTNLITKIVRQQMEVVLKSHTERITALGSKTGHMAAAAAFLNVQALMDLVPNENRKDVIVMYENARKKAVAYMKAKTTEFDDEQIFEGSDNT